MRTALVIEINGSKALVIKPGGEFSTVRAKKKWSKGDIVSVANTDFQLKSFTAMAACLVLTFIVALGSYRLYFNQAALVSIDINPSIELGLNVFDRVIWTVSYNDDGERLLSAAPVRGKKYDSALALIFSSEEMAPYMSDNSYLDIAVSGNGTIQPKIQAEVEELTASYKVQVTCRGIDGEIITDAHAHGMTPGRYLAFLELQELQPDIAIDDYASCGIGLLRKEIDDHHQNRQGRQGDGQGQPSGHGHRYGH